MSDFIIEGGYPISGEIRLSGSKNAVLPMIAASLLTEDDIVLHNVPDIIDVAAMLKIAETLGVKCERSGTSLKLRAGSISSGNVPQALSNQIRTSLLFAGPLLHRCREVSFWPPGGDDIGRRRIDAHLYGLKCLGAKLLSEEPPFALSAPQLKGRDLFFDEASVTATEHIMMAAAVAKGRTVIRNAASEPHVQDLAELLRKMGAKITGTDSNTITVEGVEKLHGAEHTVIGDHVEAGSFLAMSAATGGDLTIHGTIPRHYWMMRRVFERFGAKFALFSDRIHLHGGQRLSVKPDFGNAIPVVSDGPWPQYPTDMMSCTIVMATQARGTTLFFEKMFESRMYFVDRLIMMGANAIVCDPHRVVITGPAKLRGLEMSSPDIRAGMAMLIAALCAKGSSTIHRAEVISRGYENIDQKIVSLGGKIKRA
ncbi:MAG TPA: UDP-N-acetylglucosamine 1-carboxyvinyltransferase [Lentisphaeria bacterium]|nr:MAG: UDP-N-acetylglucosamine 1-carboxyvinyltransferase [Lentisphaerae bacterium GWF2_49_21]HBC87614.1 UDP-N-acetylglucosamine 1-carboxyvinyltransferase [Lentisphaeria bacterium]